MNTTAKFTREHGSLANGGTGCYLVLKSEGFADILVQRTMGLGGYGIFRRGDTDLVAHFRTQAEAKAYAVEALEIDQAA